MRICVISLEYPPHHGGTADEAGALARHLAAAGHDVHVVTGRAQYGADQLRDQVEVWQEGLLTVHRLHLLDGEDRAAAPLRFCEMNTAEYPDSERLWAHDASNLVAAAIAGFVRSLHAVVGFDVAEVFEHHGLAYYMIRQRRAGRPDAFPPICVAAHASTRLRAAASGDLELLGNPLGRDRMQREEYCLRHADALVTPTASLMERLASVCGELPQLRDVIPLYPAEPTTADAATSQVPTERFVLAHLDEESAVGADLALRAFARLAAVHADLHMVLLGRNSVVDAALTRAGTQLSATLRERVVRIGHRAAGQHSVALRDAAVVVRGSPAHGVPYAIAAAMTAGTACVVPDHVSATEFLENGSALTYRQDDLEALVAALARVLDDAELRERLGRHAKDRIGAMANAAANTAARLALYEQLTESDVYTATLPTTLPGSGLVVVDGVACDPQLLTRTLESVGAATAASKHWRVVVLVDGDSVEQVVPPDFETALPGDAPPWSEAGEQDHLIWVRGGVRLEPGRLASLVTLALASPHAAGTFCWLRPPSVTAFPYPADGGFADFLCEGSVVPVALCVPATHLRGAPPLRGLQTAVARCAAIAAAATLTNGGWLLHTGSVGGDDYAATPILTATDRDQALGFCALLGVLPTALRTTYSRTRVVERTVTAPTPADLGIDPKEIDALRRIADEHMRLKNHRLVRFLRRFRIFDFARSVVPGSKKLLGSGRS